MLTKRYFYILISLIIIVLFVSFVQFAPKYYFNKGLEYEKAGSYNQAMDSYSNAIKFAPKNGTYYFQRGRLIYHSQFLSNKSEELTSINPERGESDFKKSIELNETNTMAYFFLGLVNLKKGAFKESINYFSKAISLNTSLYDAYFWRGYAKKESNNDNQGALQDFTIVVDNLAKTNAVVIYDGAIKLHSACSGVFFERGCLFTSLGKYDDAIKDFVNAIEVSKDTAEIYNKRGDAKRLKEDYKGALIDYSKAIDLDQDLAEAFFNRGRVKAILGDKEGSNSDIQNAVNLGYKIESQTIDSPNENPDNPY